MIDRVLLAVDDSPPALAAARLAVDLAAGWSARLRAVTVVANHVTAWRLGEGGLGGPAELAPRRTRTAEALLRHVHAMAEQRGIEVDTALLDGEPARQVLLQARSWPADLIVIGRSDRTVLGEPYVGSQVRHVLEFADVPVLVVPYQPRA